jgi:hypothetical protein
MALTDLTSSYISTNSAFQNMLGYTDEEVPARPLVNVNAINLCWAHELTADPNEANRARPPAFAYAIWPPPAAPVAPSGAVPNASVIALADAMSAMRAAHRHTAMRATIGLSAMWATIGLSATGAAIGLSATGATIDFLGQLDIGRGSSSTERLRVDWDSMDRIAVCDRQHGSDGER